MEETRQYFNEGQELIFQDLNKIPSRMEKLLFDRVLFELIRKKQDGFFGDSFFATYSTPTRVILSAGIGFQNVSGLDDWEPENIPIYLSSDLAVDFATPDPSNPRIDIVCIKYSEVDGETESRKYKNETTEAITNENFVTSKGWGYEVLVVEGTAAGSPAVPSTPAGYIKVCECAVAAVTGMASQSSVTDKRIKFPLTGIPTETGSNEYDAVVGDTDLFGVNYSNLKDAINAASAGWKILVLESETIDSGTLPVVNKDNIEIIFKRGVTFTKGTSTIGIQVDNDDCKVVNGRFLDFSAGGDKAIVISSGADRTMIRDTRFNNCITNIDNNGTKTSELGTITE